MFGADRGQRAQRPVFDLMRRSPDVLQAERNLVEDPREDDLVLRILEHRRDRAGQASRAVPPRVESRDLDAAREAAAVEVRDQAGERAEEGRLPGARTPEHQRDLSRDQVRGHVPKRWCRGAGVREGNLLRDS